MRNFIFILVLITSFFSNFAISSDYSYSKELPASISVEEIEDMSLNELESQMLKDYEEMSQKNGDLIGILNIPSVGYFPVMYTGDQKYINHNFSGEYEFKGVPFMNRNSFGRFEENTLIHAHTMRDGSMFSALRNYKEPDFFQKSDPIVVFDGEDFRYYKPFTTLNIEDGKEFIKQKNIDPEENEKYLKSLKDRSIVPTEEGLELDFSGDTLFLQTCDYNFFNSRLIVGSYLIEKKPANMEVDK